MVQELTESERQALAREIAADKYDQEWPLRTTIGNVGRESFLAGWDAAMGHVKEQRN